MRRVVVAAIAVASILVTSALMASIGAGDVAIAATLTPPPEGIFENCALDAAMPTCAARLGAMHAGGLQVVVISAAGTSLRSLATYAALAHLLGMSVMWELGSPRWWEDPSTSTSMDSSYGAFASACGCDENGPLLSYLVQWLSELPGTYGYYAADDSMLAPGDAPAVATYVALIKREDRTHPVMISASQQSEVDRYQGLADLVGTEIYPVTTTSLLPVSGNQGTWDGVAQTAIDAQRSADVAGKASAFILQAFTWGDNLDDGVAIGVCSRPQTSAECYGELRYPSAGDQLQLRNEVLEHAHPALILWWSFPGTYGQAGSDTYSIYPSGSLAASRWSGLVSAIRAPWPAARVARQRHASERRTRRLLDKQRGADRQ